MKKVFFIVLITLFTVQCSSLNKRDKNDETKEIVARALAIVKDDTIHEDWSSYSYGLSCKIYAIEHPKSPERGEYLKKAIHYFMESAKTGHALDRVYYQLSDCSYYQYGFSESIKYAEKSIAVNPSYIKPYNRMYTIYMRLKNYNKAAEVFERYLEVKPDSIHLQFLLAEHYYKKLSDVKKAKDAFVKVIDISNGSASDDYYKGQAYFYLGYIAYKENRPDESLEYFKKVVKINAENDRAIYMLAALYMDKFNFDLAEKYSRSYLSKYPDNLVINSIMGRIRYVKNYPDAIHYLRVAGRAKSIDGYLARGLYLELNGEDKKALKTLSTVVRYRPKLIATYGALADIKLRADDKKGAFKDYVRGGVLAFQNKLYDVAKDFFKNAYSLDGDDVEVLYYLGRIYEETGHNSIAFVYYKKVNELKPSVDMMLHIGYLYGVNKEYEKAFKYFNMASKREPQNARPYFFKGLISIWRKDYLIAEDNIKKAIELNGKSETYYFYLAVVLEKLKKVNEAIDSLEIAVKKYPGSARVYNYLGYIYADNDMKIDRSLYLIQEALKIEPGNGAYLDSLGWVYYRKGNYKLALRKLLQAEKQLDEARAPDPVVYDHIGDAYKKIGRSSEAIIYWNKSLDIEKNNTIENKIKQEKKTFSGNKK